jgi:hypothetical protein
MTKCHLLHPLVLAVRCKFNWAYRDRHPLQREQGTYVVQIPADGKITTSTVLSGSPKFTVAGTGRIWGYTASIYRTGDGLPVGGSLEFFVGTKEQFEAYEARKPKSQEISDQPANRVERQYILLT